MQANQGNMNQQPGQPRVGLGLVVLIVQAFAASVEVFLRRDIGSRYLDKQAAVAILVILVFAALCEPHDPEPLMWFLGAYLVMCGVVRAKSLRRRNRGEEGHSRYNGWPRILGWPVFRRMIEARAKAVAEPLLLYGAGFLTMPLSVSLGAYLMVSGFALMLSHGLIAAHDRVKQMDLQDAMFEQRQASERFRRWQSQAKEWRS